MRSNIQIINNQATSRKSDFTYCNRCYRSVVCLFLLSVTFVHCAQTAEDIDMISFVFDSPLVSLSHTALQFGLHRLNPPSLLNFAPD